MKGQANGWLSVASNIPEKKSDKNKASKKLVKFNWNKNKTGKSFSSSSFINESVTLLDTSNYRQTNISNFLKKKPKIKEHQKHVFPGKENIPPTDHEQKFINYDFSDDELSVPVVSMKNAHKVKTFGADDLLQPDSSDENFEESPTIVKNLEPSLRKHINFQENRLLRQMHEESCNPNLDPIFLYNEESEKSFGHKINSTNRYINSETVIDHKSTKQCEISLQGKSKEMKLDQTEISPNTVKSSKEDLFSMNLETEYQKRMVNQDSVHLVPNFLQKLHEQSCFINLDPVKEIQDSKKQETFSSVEGEETNFLQKLHEQSLFTNLDPFQETQEAQNSYRETFEINKLDINDRFVKQKVKEIDCLKKLHEQSLFTNLDPFVKTEEEQESENNSIIQRNSETNNYTIPVLERLHEQSCLTNLDPFDFTEENERVSFGKEVKKSAILHESQTPDIKLSRDNSMDFNNTLDNSFFSSHTSSTSSQQKSQCVCNMKTFVRNNNSCQEKKSENTEKIDFDDFWDT